MSLLQKLKSSGFVFKKSLGQNFITDTGLLAGIARDLKLKPTDTVIEIGTGAGTLTRVLSDKVKRVITFEVDNRLQEILGEQFSGIENIELIFADALKFPDKEIVNLAGGSFSVVANIPYYITTPLLMKFAAIAECERICVLVQDDVARRITAPTGCKDYGALSVAMQTMFDCKILKSVPRTVFTPRPNVDSAFVVLNRICIPDAGGIPDEKLLKGLFAARRKTVLNGIGIVLELERDKAREILRAAGVDENVRPEQVSPEQFIRLSQVIFTKS